MPDWNLSEAYANLWIYDTPLAYSPAYGPNVPFRLAFNSNRTGGSISGHNNQGALAGNHWNASWLSYAEVDASGYSAEVSMPGSGWTGFSFQVGATNSDIEYRRNTRLEQVFQGSSLVGLRLPERDGSYLEYGNLSDQGTYKLFFLTGWYDPQGNKISFSYTNNLLSSVTFADNASFQIYYNDPNDATLLTLVTNTSSGASATLIHGETGPGNPDNYQWPQNLTTIIDAAGISNNVWYPYPARLAGSMVTPYGTTRFTYGSAYDNSVFDEWIRITRADSSQEFFGWINSYAGTDWPAFATSQIPTNTPVNTLDITNRNERNTFFWDSRHMAIHLATTTPTCSIPRWMKIIRRRYWKWNTGSPQRTLAASI